MSENFESAFRYVDLFAGIGGFAAALEGFGGRCVYSVEIDERAARIYEQNWGHSPLGDVTDDANDIVMKVPDHDVLVAGFPCQPFSKSGAQRGMDEARGTLFWNIAKILEARRPSVVMLENVRNLAGPRHRHEWEVIIETLRSLGYHVADEPAVFSPHLLPLESGGRPHMRERVFITATYDPDHMADQPIPAPAVVNKSLRQGEEWLLEADLPLDPETHVEGFNLTDEEIRLIDAWDAWVTMMWPLIRSRGDVKLPGFPLWVDHWVDEKLLDNPRSKHFVSADVPAWKANFLRKNATFYTKYAEALDEWINTYDVQSFAPSRRKFEWQAQQTETLWECVMQMRPSGIRAKRPTHVPALVAITQTTIVGPRRRRLAPREAARLQGFPDSFDFAGQPHAATYKQLGNGVNVGVVWHVLREHVKRDAYILGRVDGDGLPSDGAGRAIVKAITVDAPKSPDDVLERVVAEARAKYMKSDLKRSGSLFL